MLFLEDGFTAGFGKGIELKFQVLVAGRNAGVANSHG